MDCIRAREIVSEAFDQGVANTPQAAEAREHCRGCDDCRTFVEGLSALAMIAPPTAPPALVDDIVDRARKMAEAGVQPQVVRAVPSPEQAPERAPLPPEARRPRTPAWWAQRAGVAVAAAAVLVLALSISIQGFRQLGSKSTGVPVSVSAPQASYAPQENASGGAVAGSSDYRMSTDGAKAAAEGGPRYVSFGEEAYAWIGDRTPEEGSLTQIGTLSSSLGTSSTIENVNVWRSRSDPDIIFIRTPDSSAGMPLYTAFKRVERERGGKPFVLFAGDGLTSFGVWPSLPSNLTTPTASDGYPTFVPAGRDDSGLEVFAPQGAKADDGFALAPATAGADPAAGNPNWTWWLPKKGTP